MILRTGPIVVDEQGPTSHTSTWFKGLMILRTGPIVVDEQGPTSHTSTCYNG